MSKVESIVNRALRSALSGLMILLLFDVVWQVFSRYVLRDPSSFTDELARYLLIWLALLGAAYITGQKMHIAIDLLSKKLNSGWINGLVQLAIICFVFLVFIVGGIRLVTITLQLEQQSAALQIPLGYIYLVLPLSGALMLFFLSMDLIKTFRSSS